MRRLSRFVFSGIWIALPFAASAYAQELSPAEFYKGRNVTVITTGSQGSIYDLSARLITRHMAKYIPGNPIMVPQVMTGGGHIVGTNYLYNVAPKDGSALGSIGETMPLIQVLEPQKVRFDVSKFNWIGNPNVSNLTLVAWHTSGIKTIQDVMERELIVGASGATSPSAFTPRALNNILGTKFKIITGFPGAQIDLAMERGEVSGRGSAQLTWWKSARQDWLRDKKINILVQVGLKKAEELQQAPLLTDLARSEAERQIFMLLSSTVVVGRPILTTPGVPADRLAVLREAFVKTMVDKTYLAEADKAGFEVDPIYADEMQKVISEVIATPPEVVILAKAAISQGQEFDCKALVKDQALCQGAGRD